MRNICLFTKYRILVYLGVNSNYLITYRSSLKPKGLVIVKENVTSSGEVEKDEQDSSVTRPLSAFRQLFILAGFDCYRVVKHSNFPKCLYNVYMFALQVLEDSETNTSTNVTEDTRSSQKDAVNCQSVSTPLSGKSENVEITNDPLVLNLKKLNISLDI